MICYINTHITRKDQHDWELSLIMLHRFSKGVSERSLPKMNEVERRRNKGVGTEFHPSISSWCSGKKPTFQCRKHMRYEFLPWVEKMPLELERQPSPVFLPGISHGERSLVCSPWDPKKLAFTERLSHLCVTRDNLWTVAHLTCVPCNGFSLVSKWNWRWNACQYILKKFS